MNLLQHRFALSLKLLLIVTLLLSPFVVVNLSARAAPLAQDQQPGSQDEDVVILNRVQNPDGTTTVTMRIYATPNDPNAPNTTFWTSQDTYIASGVPNGNYGSSPTMGIGFSNTGPQAMRMLLQFNMSGIPAGSTINSANIFVFQNAVSPAGDAPMGFQAQYAVSSWNEFNATWNNANFIGGAALPIGNFPSTLGWLVFPQHQFVSETGLAVLRPIMASSSLAMKARPTIAAAGSPPAMPAATGLTRTSISPPGAVIPLPLPALIHCRPLRPTLSL